MEANQVQTAVRRRVLILLPDRLAAALDLDFTRQTREGVFRHVLVAIGEERVEQADGV